MTIIQLSFPVSKPNLTDVISHYIPNDSRLWCTIDSIKAKSCLVELERKPVMQLGEGI